MPPGQALEAKPHLLASTRCRARCLSQLEDYLNSLEELGLSTILLRQQHSASLETCLQDQSCSSCIRPCDLQPSNYAACPAYCQDEDSDCHGTCAFLRQMEEGGVSPGACPNDNFNVPSHVASAICVSSCDIDSDCDPDSKCCATGCGRSCKVAVASGDQPPIPHHLNVVERKNGRSATLEWSMGDSLKGPVIFIVQSKSHMGMNYNRLLMPQEWHHVALVVDHREVTIKEMELGHWYVFRVAAVNANGSAGFSVGEVPFKLKTEPRAPSHPTNITEVDSKIVEGKYSVTIDWEAPKQTDLPISKYKIFWSRRIQGETTLNHSLKEHKKTVQGKLTEYVFNDLEPNCVYLVQVQAMIQYGDTKLRSKKAHLFVSTFPEKTSDYGNYDLFYSDYDYNIEDKKQKIPEEEEVATPSPLPKPIVNLTHHSPYFQDGVIKAKIEWSPVDDEATQQVMVHWAPDVCIADQSSTASESSGPITKTVTATTRENSYQVFDLRFDCRYTVHVRGMSPTGKLGPVATTSFFVHGCRDIEIEGTSDVLPACPTAAPPNVPSRPMNLTYLYMIGSSSNINVRFMWNYPRFSDRPLTGWRVTWGQRLHLLQPSLPRPLLPDGSISGSPILDERNAAVSQVIPESELEFTINDLEEATDYIFQLQALSEVGDGEVAQILLTTPQLSMEPFAEQEVGRGYRRGGAIIEDNNDYGQHYSQTNEHFVSTDHHQRQAKTLRTLSESYSNGGLSTLAFLGTQKFIFSCFSILYLWRNFVT